MKTKMNAKTTFLGCLAAVLFLTTAAQAADPSGIWTWKTPGRNGAPDRVNTLTLSVADAKLTGKVSVPGRDGQPQESAITDGKVDGDNITFNLVREFNGNSSTNKYSGALSADTITGQIEFNRNGETQTRKWEAKRSTDGK